MTRKVVAYLFAAVLIIIGSGCNRRPDGVLEDEEMVSLMTDMQLAEAYASAHYHGQESEKQKQLLASGVLKKHGVSKEMLETSLDWYGHNLDKFEDLYEKVDHNIAVKRKKLIVEDSEQRERKDILDGDLWPHSRHAVLSDNSTNGTLVFSIDNPELEKGDVMEWSLRFNTENGGRALLGADYTDGTSTYITNQHTGGRKFRMRMQTDTTRVVKRLYGYISRTENSPNIIWLDSIFLTRQPFVDEKYGDINLQKRLYAPLRRRAHISTKDSVGIATPEGTVQDVQSTKQTSVKENSRPAGNVSPSSLTGSGKRTVRNDFMQRRNVKASR